MDGKSEHEEFGSEASRDADAMEDGVDHSDNDNNDNFTSGKDYKSNHSGSTAAIAAGSSSAGSDSEAGAEVNEHVKCATVDSVACCQDDAHATDATIIPSEIQDTLAFHRAGRTGGTEEKPSYYVSATIRHDVTLTLLVLLSLICRTGSHFASAMCLLETGCFSVAARRSARMA